RRASGWSGWGWPRWPASAPTRCRAARPSAWPWQGLCTSGRGCCSPTSRSPASTRTRRPTSCSSCATSPPARGSRSSACSTSSTWRCASRTGSSGCGPDASSSTRAPPTSAWRSWPRCTAPMAEATAAPPGWLRIWRAHAPRSLLGLGVAIVLVQAYVVIDARPGDILTGVAGIADIVRRGLPPDPAVLGPALFQSLVTIDVAIVGTALAIAFSLLLGFWAAENVTPGGPFYAVSRAIIAVFRAVPDIVWALLFVTAVGLGPFAATMGLAVHSIGVLGRLYAEAIEDVPMASVNALVVTGANRVQVATHAVLPATMPTLVGLTLYRMDTNVRSSLVLGFVGGGGLGFAIENALNLFQYQKLVALLIVMALLIAGVEAVAVALRRTIH